MKAPALSRRTRDIALLDRVYDHVSLPPVVVAAIDTPYIQRLRGLKQLGASSYLYPGAVHTRFEHSIGVAHLARQFLNTISAKQPELNITQRDIEMAMLAGLAHDVGHGPFSHLFEDVITKRSGVRFVHEDMSEKILLKMLQPMGLDQEFIDTTISLVRGKGNTKEGVNSTASSASPSSFSSSVPYWELISNKRNGIDVDRLDYLFRDSLCCFGKPTIDVRVNRLFNAARIVHVRGDDVGAKLADEASKNGLTQSGSAAEPHQYRLVFEGKMAVNIRELFGLRAKLHKSVYQHHVVKAVGHMIGDCLALAAPHFRIGGKTMMECVDDIETFCQLGDWILDAVACDPNPNLHEAKEVIRRLRSRDLYVLAGSINMKDPNMISSDNIDQRNNSVLTEELIQSMLTETAKSMGLSELWDPSNLVVDVVVINHGKGNKDPLSAVDFFNPKHDRLVSEGGKDKNLSLADTTELFKLAGTSPLLSPSSFEERTIMIFSKDRQHTGLVRKVFDRWRSQPEVSELLFEGLSFHNPRS